MRLTDRYTQECGRVYLTGIQALVRLPLDQMRRDRRAGLKTGAFISGYEGSPLGGYDLALLRNRALLDELDIHVRPAVNEDLAATAIWGSQILDAIGPTKYDGILGIWYGKGPGVDRSGDALRHANFTGNSSKTPLWSSPVTTQPPRVPPSRIRATSVSTISRSPSFTQAQYKRFWTMGFMRLPSPASLVPGRE